MIRTYTTYGMTLISAFAVFWTFGLFSTVAAGSTWVPFSGFLASILHFGISSWIFLHFQKTGKIIAILTGTIMCIWPISTFAGSLTNMSIFMSSIFALPIILTGFVIYNHLKTFNQKSKPNLTSRVLLRAC